MNLNGSLPAGRSDRSTPVIFGIISPPFFHIDHIAEPDIEQRDLFGIVQRSPFDGCAGQRHRIEVGDRRHRPGTPDLKIDRQQPGAGLLRFEFIGYGPARSLAV